MKMEKPSCDVDAPLVSLNRVMWEEMWAYPVQVTRQMNIELMIARVNVFL